MRVADVLVFATVVVLAVSALLALYRIARGPTGLDRGVASDVMLAIFIAAVGAYTIWQRTPVALIEILVLSLVGFTSAVGLARLITGATVRERRFLEAEARSAYAASGEESARPARTTEADQEGSA